jgi:hypothetical protein
MRGEDDTNSFLLVFACVSEKFKKLQKGAALAERSIVNDMKKFSNEGKRAGTDIRTSFDWLKK